MAVLGEMSKGAEALGWGMPNLRAIQEGECTLELGFGPSFLGCHFLEGAIFRSSRRLLISGSLFPLPPLIFLLLPLLFLLSLVI